MSINEQRKKVEEEIAKLEHMGGSLRGQVESLRDSAFERFPVLFVLASSFGLVATFYGFEKFIDDIPYFIEHPRMILITGVLVLIATGSLYKKLS